MPKLCLLSDEASERLRTSLAVRLANRGNDVLSPEEAARVAHLDAVVLVTTGFDTVPELARIWINLSNVSDSDIVVVPPNRPHFASRHILHLDTDNEDENAISRAAERLDAWTRAERDTASPAVLLSSGPFSEFVASQLDTSPVTPDVVRLPASSELLSPIVFAVATQLFSMHLAYALGVDPQHPRGLQKITLTH